MNFIQSLPHPRAHLLYGESLAISVIEFLTPAEQFLHDLLFDFSETHAIGPYFREAPFANEKVEAAPSFAHGRRVSSLESGAAAHAARGVRDEPEVSFQSNPPSRGNHRFDPRRCRP